MNDGTGHPAARLNGEQACTRIGPGRDFGLVDVRSRVQFCLPVAAAWGFAAGARAWGFPEGDTIIGARLADVFGSVGVAREIVVRVGE